MGKKEEWMERKIKVREENNETNRSKGGKKGGERKEDKAGKKEANK